MKLINGALHYLHRLGNVLSQVINVVFFLGNPDECISGRVYRLNIPWAIAVINAVFFWEANHCRESYYNDLSYAGAVMSRHKKVLKSGRYP
jgi:hypothetical protein